MNDQRIWRRALNLFGPLSLSSMAGMSIGGGIFFLVSLVAIFRNWAAWGKRALREATFNPYGAFTLAFFLIAFVSLAVAWIAPPLGVPVSGFGELKKFHHFLFPPLFALAFLRTAESIEEHPFWKFWGAMGIFLFFVAFAQFFAADLFPASWLTHRFFRQANTTGHFHGQGLMFFHLSFAACMSFVAAAGLSRLLWPRVDDSLRTRIFWAAVGVGGFFAVYFSFSRIALGGLVVLVAFLGFLRKPRWGVVISALAVAIAFVVYQTVPAVHTRFVDASSYNSERYLMWESAWAMFKERPLVGLGFGRSGQYSPAFAERILGHEAAFTSHAHNNVLDLLASVGALGLLAYLLWWGWAFVSAWLSFRAAKPEDRWLPAAALAGFVAFQVNGLTQVNFWDGKSEHTMMLWVGVVLALELRRKRLAART